MKKSIYICTIIVSLFVLVTACEVTKFRTLSSYLMTFFDIDELELRESSSQSIEIKIKPKGIISYDSNNTQNIVYY